MSSGFHTPWVACCHSRNTHADCTLIGNYPSMKRRSPDGYIWVNLDAFRSSAHYATRVHRCVVSLESCATPPLHKLIHTRDILPGVRPRGCSLRNPIKEHRRLVCEAGGAEYGNCCRLHRPLPNIAWKPCGLECQTLRRLRGGVSSFRAREFMPNFCPSRSCSRSSVPSAVGPTSTRSEARNTPA